MALVRVFLPTYRRAALLQRAIDSLRAQTFGDWVCEVHNDAPEDDQPRDLLSRLADRRFILVQHPRNLGGTATFNLFFRESKETFYSMLEDDNWWEPNFLAQMLATAEANPDISLCWANMRLWKECTDGTFVDTRRCVWPSATEPTRRFAWGQPEQICGALHSHGAALVRSRTAGDLSTPAVPIAAVELFRERALPHPLMFVTAPLANFSVTVQSARSNDRGEWAEIQTALAATYLKCAQLQGLQSPSVWANARSRRLVAASTLLLAGIVEPACRSLLRDATVSEWLRFVLSIIRSPKVFYRVVRSRRRHPDWWTYLERHTARRFVESTSSPAQ